MSKSLHPNRLPDMKRTTMVLVLGAVLGLGSACSAIGTAATPETRASEHQLPLATDVSLLERLRATEGLSNEPKRLARAGIEHLLGKRLAEASKVFNAALQLNPSHSYLQLLNGLTYHLMASAGDSEKLDLAEQGYLLAIKFDGSNWLARYYLGNLRLDRRQYREAQTAFAEALLYMDSDREMLYQLSAASYYAGDPVTAAGALERLEALEPNQPKVQRALAVVLAALGRADEADAYLKRYRATQTDPRAANRLADRLRGWRRFHQNAGVAGPVRVQFNPSPGQEPPAEATQEQSAEAAQEQPAEAAQEQPAEGGAVQEAPQAATSEGERMVLVDVVILRTEDLITTKKGVNLLSSLKIQFGGTSSAPAFSSAVSHGTDATGGLTGTSTITHAITIPSLEYSLNIANANSSSNEILARPTIAALEGVTSEFFSGTGLSAAAVAGGTAGGSAVQIEKEIGVKLGITPQFLSDDKVKMAIIAERTFLKTPSSDNNFQYKIETSKTTVNAQSVLKFGETLILSGLSEKETNRTRDGVPLLQDVPILQYLFSQSTTSNFQRSVLILVTPRRADYVYRGDQNGKGAVLGSGQSGALSELRARYLDWFKPYPNLASVFHHLGSSSLYREFRTGDVTLERWERQGAVEERLHQVVDFLYY
ncbi:MAG: tetratricopeptide repeat protein [Sulfuritalea sp.]|nr:tetratricopeptide repeat protein [Sulfuritalea sp.]